MILRLPPPWTVGPGAAETPAKQVEQFLSRYCLECHAADVQKGDRSFEKFTLPLKTLPETIDEGRFGFFAREDLGAVAVPETDRTLLWPVYDEHRRGFIAYRAECHPGAPLRVVVEETSAKPNLD